MYNYKYFLRFICQREHRQGEGQAEGEAGSPLSREPTWGSIPRPWDHDLSQR